MAVLSGEHGLPMGAVAGSAGQKQLSQLCKMRQTYPGCDAASHSLTPGPLALQMRDTPPFSQYFCLFVFNFSFKLFVF